MNFNTNNEMNYQSFNNTKRPNNGINNATTIQNTSMNATINDKNVSNVSKVMHTPQPPVELSKTNAYNNNNNNNNNFETPENRYTLTTHHNNKNDNTFQQAAAAGGNNNNKDGSKATNDHHLHRKDIIITNKNTNDENLIEENDEVVRLNKQLHESNSAKKKDPNTYNSFLKMGAGFSEQKRLIDDLIVRTQEDIRQQNLIIRTKLEKKRKYKEICDMIYKTVEQNNNDSINMRMEIQLDDNNVNDNNNKITTHPEEEHDEDDTNEKNEVEDIIDETITPSQSNINDDDNSNATSP